MQANWDKLFQIPSKEESPPLSPSESESTNPKNLDEEIVKGETAIVPQPPTASTNATPANPMEKFLQNTQQTFQKWQQDWELNTQKNREKMKLQNAKIKTQWEENNRRIKTHFQKQRDDFNQKIQKIQTDLKAKDAARKENFEKTNQAMTDAWNNVVKQQKKDMENFSKIQTRLWWKGYLNVMLWILGFILVIAGVLWLLKVIGLDISTINTNTP